MRGFFLFAQIAIDSAVKIRYNDTIDVVASKIQIYKGNQL